MTKSIEELRRSEQGMKDRKRGNNTVSFAELQKAEMVVCLATVLARCSQLKDPLLDYPSREIASAMGVGQLEYYRIMESRGYMRMLRDWPAVETHVAEWKKTNGKGLPLGYILAMEGADPILEPSQVEVWFERGLRVVEPVHYGVSYYAHGTGVPGGLTAKGKRTTGGLRSGGNDSGHHPPGRRKLLAIARSLPRTGIGQPSQLPGARTR